MPQRGKIIDELTEFLEERAGCVDVSLAEKRKIALENIEKSQSNNLKHFSIIERRLNFPSVIL